MVIKMKFFNKNSCILYIFIIECKSNLKISNGLVAQVVRAHA